MVEGKYWSRENIGPGKILVGENFRRGKLFVGATYSSKKLFVVENYFSGKIFITKRKFRNVSPIIIKIPKNFVQCFRWRWSGEEWGEGRPFYSKGK